MAHLFTTQRNAGGDNNYGGYKPAISVRADFGTVDGEALKLKKSIDENEAWAAKIMVSLGECLPGATGTMGNKTVECLAIDRVKKTATFDVIKGFRADCRNNSQFVINWGGDMQFEASAVGEADGATIGNITEDGLNFEASEDNNEAGECNNTHHVESQGDENNNMSLDDLRQKAEEAREAANEAREKANEAKEKAENLENQAKDSEAAAEVAKQLADEANNEAANDPDNEEKEEAADNFAAEAAASEAKAKRARAKADRAKEEAENAEEDAENKEGEADQAEADYDRAKEEAENNTPENEENNEDSEGDENNNTPDEDIVKTAVYDVVKAYVNTGFNVMLIGQAGTGKTYITKIVADELGASYYSMGTTYDVAEVKGYNDANGRYVESIPYKAFKEAKLNPLSRVVLVFDEGDSWAADCLLAANEMIANKSYTFPNGESIYAPNVVVIMCTNTPGHGQSEAYSGRAKLDVASLNRFGKVIVDYSPEIDFKTAKGDVDLIAVGHAVRELVKDNLGMPYVMTPRDFSRIKAIEAVGVPVVNCLEGTFADWTKDAMQQLIFRVSESNKYYMALNEVREMLLV